MSLRTIFEKSVGRSPDNIALIHHYDSKRKVTLKYQEIHQIIQKVICKLQCENENHRKMLVYAEEGPAAIVLLLSIMKLKGTFVYLSTENVLKPDIINILEPSHLIMSNKYVLNTSKFKEIYRDCLEFHILDEKFIVFKNIKNGFSNVKMTEVSPYKFDDLVYIMFTSGTTGFPKWVYVENQCIIPNIYDFVTIFDMNPNDKLFSAAPLTFDPSIVNIFTTFLSCASLLTVAPAILRMPNILSDILIRENVSILSATPSLLKIFNVTFLKENLFTESSKLRIVALGGERFPNFTFIRQFLNTDSKIKIFNLYGLTEVSCWATICNITEFILNNTSEYPPIGTNLSLTNIKLLDKNGEETTEGEICIISDNRKTLIKDMKNKELFYVRENIFRTGDIGYLKDGHIFYKCRMDGLIKRNGKKMYLNELEDILLSNSKIQNCYIHNDFDNKIACFVVSTMSELEIFSFLKSSLESYKLPDQIFVVENIPLNNHGKVDVTGLKNKAKEERKIAILNKQGMSNLWFKYINLFPNRNDNFIIQGGNSILAILFIEEVKSCMEYNVPGLLETLLNSDFESVCDLVLNSDMPDNNASDSPVPIISQRTARVLKTEHMYYDTIANSKNGYFINNTKHDYIENSVPILIELDWKVNLYKCVDSSPIVLKTDKEQKVFVGSHSSKLVCVDIISGKCEWCIELGDRIETTPCLSSDGLNLYVGSYDYKMYCINVKNGSVKWAFKTQGIIKSSPVLSDQFNNIIFGSYDKYTYCLNMDGSLKWKIKVSNGSIFSSPVIYKKHVFIGTLDNKFVCIDCITGNQMFIKHLSAPIFSSPVLLSNNVVVATVSGDIYCYSILGNLVWQKRDANGLIFSSPFVLSFPTDILCYGCHDNCLYFYNKSGILLLRHILTSPIYATPYIFYSQLDKSIYCIVCETKGNISLLRIKVCDDSYSSVTIETVVTIYTKDEIFSSPVIFQSRVMFGSRDNYLYCFKLT